MFVYILYFLPIHSWLFPYFIIKFWTLGLYAFCKKKVYIQAPCCNKWFECAECHDDAVKTHVFELKSDMRFTCKPCRKVFTRDFKLFSESDKLCSFCKNCWIIPGITPESRLMDNANELISITLDELLDNRNNFFSTLDSERMAEKKQGKKIWKRFYLRSSKFENF